MVPAIRCRTHRAASRGSRRRTGTLLDRRAAHNAHEVQMKTPGVDPSSVRRLGCTARPQQPQRAVLVGRSVSGAAVVITCSFRQGYLRIAQQRVSLAARLQCVIDPTGRPESARSAGLEQAAPARAQVAALRYRAILARQTPRCCVPGTEGVRPETAAPGSN